ncbi:MAG: DUF2752 domain-containing protein [Lachnospiraceae bacterium]|nr:DUF2752 domain-containing protein [Lachnospiraceae bacterium]
MKKSFKKTDLKKVIPAALALGLLAILVILRIYKCPLDYIFGIPCPMCGITRAFLALLQGDVRGAFYCHPLWPVMLLAGILYALDALGVIGPSKKAFNAAGYTLCVLLIICFIIRHVQDSPVVRIHFDTSLIYRIWSLLLSLFSARS